ncbi:MAG TPA: FixG Ig-like domain-containing protein [Gemmatimonadaceae bacterium]|nr:FixG Ig-like domain-containing protein [Gemmatimonadaceae bacterium]
MIYPAALALFLGTFVFQLTTKADADVVLLRGVGAPFVIEPDGRVMNQVRVKITNRTASDQRYTLQVTDAEVGTVVIPVNPFPVARGRTETTSLFVLLPASAFARGEREVTVSVSDERGFRGGFAWTLLGPGRESGGGASGKKEGDR